MSNGIFDLLNIIGDPGNDVSFSFVSKISDMQLTDTFENIDAHISDGERLGFGHDDCGQILKDIGHGK
jgi:hypothetical protein